MAIDSLASRTSSALDSYASTNKLQQASRDTAGANAAPRAREAAGMVGGRIGSAIQLALRQLGVKAADGGASAQQERAQAFAHALFSALHIALAAPADGAPPQSGLRQLGGGSKLEGGLQNLITQLDSPGPASGEAGDSPLAALQASFTSLLKSHGVSGAKATLGGFLQSLAASLAGAPAAGNVVSDKA